MTTTERHIALREGHHHAMAHAYFEANASEDNGHLRRLFEKGFERGFDAGEKVYGVAPGKPTMTEAMKVVTEALKADPDYAWSWHCNITMAQVDEGNDHAIAEHGSMRFLGLLCGEDLTPAHPLRDKGPVMRWRPIETAPKDRKVLLWGRYWNGRDDFQEPLVGQWNPHSELQRWEACGQYRFGVRPTHWMPLPAAPDDSGIEVVLGSGQVATAEAA